MGVADIYTAAVLGVGVLLWGLRLLGRRGRPQLVLPSALPAWRIEPWEFAGLLLSLFACVLVLQAASLAALQGWIGRQEDGHALSLLVYGVSFQVALLAGLKAFTWLRREHLPPPEPFRGAGWRESARGALRGFLLTQPLVTLVFFAWRAFLLSCGHPADTQDLVQVFLDASSPALRAALALTAVILVPVCEETIFRGCLYRFFKSRLGQRWAILASSLAFAAVHGNLLSFLPLVLLGAALCLCAERAGNLRAAIGMHALFNLNTIVGLLLGARP